MKCTRIIKEIGFSKDENLEKIEKFKSKFLYIVFKA
jgi:hypothetical protein